LPPLRERVEDIPLLAQHFLTRMARDSNTKTIKLSSSALKKLKGYDFPGNIRELENILERAVTLLDESSFEVENLHLPAMKKSVQQCEANNIRPLSNKVEQVEREAIIEALEETRWNRTAAAKKLGMTLRSLRYRLEKFGIE
ncbi:MAG: helix-turn-helix domain-containing protein, partial [Candidatus Thiodiazotropha endolucinida]